MKNYLREIVVDKSGRVYVYALTEPETLVVRYIGISEDPELRLSLHLSNAQSRTGSGGNPILSEWICTLLNRGLIPRMFIIEETDRENSNALERHYIGFYRAAGASVINQDKSLFEMQKIAKNYHGECTSSFYERSTRNLDWECKLGHSFKKSGARVMRGEWCSVCDKSLGVKLAELYRFREKNLRNTFFEIYELKR
ncbi:GIY-YIG nuclease family protein [Pseudomonas fluorescens]|uniref:GIY-YIG nuclease family protein n=1 Tax=Pseudomonas fluorescens TaxID=294 RepID=UPI003D06C34D